NISMIDHIQAKAGGVNVFAIEWDKDLRLGGKDMGGNPKALKGRMVFDIAPDEALVVEVEAPRAAYWSYSIGDIWYQTPDYSYHQSSLNGRQTSVDGDGRVRYVMAQQDPGAPNWIDLVGLTQGFVNFRFYDPKGGYAPQPVVRKVKLSEVRSVLPADTPTVSPEARRDSLARRARASLARYGY
ncbi:MAG: hypothetical protein JO303_08555, partial [Caulobacteraceae bacterium]|nr:hypothetical protein [Caulobacteraceae bacterium]